MSLTFDEALAKHRTIILRSTDFAYRKGTAIRLFSESNGSEKGSLDKHLYCLANGQEPVVQQQKVSAVAVHYGMCCNEQEWQQLTEPIEISTAVFKGNGGPSNLGCTIEAYDPYGIDCVCAPEEVHSLRDIVGRYHTETVLIPTDAVFEIDGFVRSFSTAQGESCFGTMFQGELQEVIRRVRDTGYLHREGFSDRAELKSVSYGRWELYDITKERFAKGKVQPEFELPLATFNALHRPATVLLTVSADNQLERY